MKPRTRATQQTSKVVPGKVVVRARRKPLAEIPEYLRPYRDWESDDFIRDALRSGYTRAQADRFALQYLYKLGRLSFVLPIVPGWMASPTPLFKDGGKVAFLFHDVGGRQFRYHALSGERLSPTQSNLAGAVVWQMKHKWILY